MGIINKITNIDGSFLNIPFETYTNQVNRTVEVTERRTQLGIEDNDHRYEKGREVSLEIVFSETLALERYAAFLKAFEEKRKGTLMLTKKKRIYKNMTMISLAESEVYRDDNDSKVLQVSFKEIRSGESRNNLLGDLENVTKSSDLYKQATGIINEKLEAVRSVYDSTKQDLLSRAAAKLNSLRGR